MEEETIFHKIVRGEAPAHIVWEDESHLAFLSIFPNTEGTTVVIPKKFQPSYFVRADEQAFLSLMSAARTVSKILDERLEDVGRTALIFEGFGVDYLHAKLFPMHGTADMSAWKPIESKREEFYHVYPGFVSSHDAKQVDDQELAALAKKLRGE